MTFKCPLIAVKNIKVSIAFYKNVFDEEVVLDFGENVTLSSGISLQQDFEKLCGFSKESILEKSHNMELYYEMDDFDGFINHLKSFKNIEYVHDVKTHSWHQRVVRIYDPDYHIIEIGEPIEQVVLRLLKAGEKEEDVAKMTQMPLAFVMACQCGMV